MQKYSEIKQMQKLTCKLNERVCCLTPGSDWKGQKQIMKKLNNYKILRTNSPIAFVAWRTVIDVDADLVYEIEYIELLWEAK